MQDAIKAQKRTRLVNWFTLADLFLGVGFLLVLIRPFGFVGASLYISLTSLVTAAIMLGLAQLVVTVPLRRVLRVLATPIPSLLVATVATWWLEHDLLRSDTRGLILAVALLAVDALVFCLIYLAVLAVFARSTVVTIVRSVPALIARFRDHRQPRGRHARPGPAGRHGVSTGEALADARRQAGLTVSCLSDRARVRETIITGIESDDYSACGSDSCARGYIRIIARAVGADPEPLIREYNTARPVPQPITDDITEPITRVQMPSAPAELGRGAAAAAGRVPSTRPGRGASNDRISRYRRFRSIGFDSGSDEGGGCHPDQRRPPGHALEQLPALGRTLTAEIGLHGPFYTIPDWLSFRRDHPERAVPTVWL